MIKIHPKTNPIKAKRDVLLLLNQIELPEKTEWVECRTAKDVFTSIRVMHVRGAPAIGVSAAYGYYLGVKEIIDQGKKPTPKQLDRIKSMLDDSRPTAVNLMWATERMRRTALDFLEKAENRAPGGATSKTGKAAKVKKQPFPSLEMLLHLYNTAVQIHEDDANRCLKMSERGADYIRKTIKKKKYRIMTHCNAGSLATGGIGTAVGLIRTLHHRGAVEMVHANETRPYLQGARLTAYELQQEKIPASLSVDSMAGVLMQKGKVDFIIVGADRIAKNGDVANKIGTYMLSVLAKEHKIPFFVIAPRSTYDPQTPNGSGIPIEERDPIEVTHFHGQRFAAKVDVINNSFDVTPRKNITAIFFEDEIM